MNLKSSLKRNQSSPSKSFPRPKSFPSFPIVAFGASAGGLEAFKEILSHLPTDTGLSFVYVQHLDPKHESILNSILSKSTAMPVQQVSHGVSLQSNHVYIIPPNHLMAISKGKFVITPRLEKAGHFMPIDYFFYSLAEEKRDQAIGVVLSGSASDGVNGLKAIKSEGGITFCQDEKSAKYDGMPRSAVLAGCVDVVLPPAQIAHELAKIGRHPYILPGKTSEELPISSENGDDLNKIFSLLRNASKVDFTFYKQATIKRRVMRRMILHKIEKIKDYVRYLRTHPPEVKALYNDILICVTNFFRDPKTFDTLKSSVFPKIIQNRTGDAPVRIWVPGCSTGEEVYSMAIVLMEYLTENETQVPVQIFGTDLSDSAIEKARSGFYPENIATDVSPDRLRRFFVRTKGGYQISKNIREMCVFAKQNITRDPPFSNMDLISCRNLLIYLGTLLQKKVLPIFHYALKNKGYLLLGSSETVGSFGDLFALQYKNHKIYSKKATSTPPHLEFIPSQYGLSSPHLAKNPPPPSYEPLDKFDIGREADRLVINRFAPPGVLINEDMEVLQFRGRTGRYLEPASGTASFNLLKLAREGLHMDIRSALHESKKTKEITIKKNVSFRLNDGLRSLNLQIFPIPVPVSKEYFYLVLFEELDDSFSDKKGQKSSSHAKDKQKREKNNSREKEIHQLTKELKTTKSYLQSIIEDQEATNEEVRSANEEIQSSNEELQSTNEELETAKEELQSANEELTTVNEELHNRNSELNQLNNDLNDFLVNIHVPIVILDRELRVRKVTQLSEKVLNVSSADVGRPFDKVRLSVDVPQIHQWIHEAVESLKVQECEVRAENGRLYSMRIHPYRTHSDVIDGAVITLLDIDDLKRLQVAQQALNYAESIIDSVREPLIILDDNLKVRSANHSFYSAFGATPKNTENKTLYEIGSGQWGAPELRKLLKDILNGKTPIKDFPFEAKFPRLGKKKLLLNACQINPKSPGPGLILIAIQEIVDQNAEIKKVSS